MKLATYRDGSRDGQLVVVSRDLSQAHFAKGVATRLQQVLDDWNFVSPQLEELSQTLNHGKARHAFAFDPGQCMAPLPRAYERSSGFAYPSHLERLHGAADTDLPQDMLVVPTMYRAASDDLAGARDDIVRARTEQDPDFGGELAVITDDVQVGTPPEAAIESIRLVMLANDLSLRRIMSIGAGGPGLLQGKPMAAFSPVAATPDEMSAAWQGGKLHLNLECAWNGRRFGLVDAAEAMRFHFGELIAHLCKTRRLRAGSIVGSGTVSHPDADRGLACIAEKRAIEIMEGGAARTGFLQPGDTVRFDMKGLDGHSVFGAIEQEVAARDEGTPLP